jgi:hypothetical protein
MKQIWIELPKDTVGNDRNLLLTSVPVFIDGQYLNSAELYEQKDDEWWDFESEEFVLTDDLMCRIFLDFMQGKFKYHFTLGWGAFPKNVFVEE